MKALALILVAAFGLPVPTDALAQNGEPGTLKGVRGVPRPAAGQPGGREVPKAKPRQGSRLMEEEGIFYFVRKPTGTDRTKAR